MSINERKKCNTHTHNGILFSHKKKEILPFATTWMELECIMLSDISQTEKEKYCMVFLTCGIFRKKERERVKLIETDSRKVVAKGWELVGGMGRG